MPERTSFAVAVEASRPSTRHTPMLVRTRIIMVIFRPQDDKVVRLASGGVGR